MGYAVKDSRYNYVEWVKLSTGEVLDKEFYDHDIDPLETQNVVGDENYKDVIATMAMVCAERKKDTDHNYISK